MIVTRDNSTSIAKRKRFLRSELERLEKIRDENVLPEILPFLKSYLTELREELRGYEDATA